MITVIVESDLKSENEINNFIKALEAMQSCNIYNDINENKNEQK